MVRPPDAAEVAALAIWDDLLRAYAETIEQQRSYLLSLGSIDDADEAMLILPMFDIPDHVPPMPASMEPWATSLVTETVGLAELAQQLLGDRPVERRPQRFQSAASGSVLDQKI